MSNNKILLVICFILLNGISSYAQTETNERLHFKNFDVTIVNFVSERPPYSENDSSKVDTLIISENPCDGDGWYIEGKTLKIVPKVKNDSFALSFAYGINISEVNSNSGNRFIYITEYETISPLGGNKFQITTGIDSDYIKSIKKKYNFKDTSVTGTSETGPYQYIFAKNGKVFGYYWGHLYLRIKRFSNGKLKENKYIKVWLTEGCD